MEKHEKSTQVAVVSSTDVSAVPVIEGVGVAVLTREWCYEKRFKSFCHVICVSQKNHKRFIM